MSPGVALSVDLPLPNTLLYLIYLSVIASDRHLFLLCSYGQIQLISWYVHIVERNIINLWLPLREDVKGLCIYPCQGSGYVDGAL